VTRKPYTFQTEVSRLLLEGHNVILQAPTGAGKTLAAMLPFLDAVEHRRNFPHKCLYAVPMRVLANQFVKEYRDLLRRAGRDDRIRAEIQTGEYPSDPRLEATLTFATIDQVLSSFLLTPYSLPRRLSNMNAGAVAASYLVFDEFHLFDPISTLPTTLEMLRMLNGIAPFLLMTATFSSDMLTGLAKVLNAVVVPSNDKDREAMQALPSQRKTRRYHTSDEPLSADSVLAHHQSRTLVVCNIVARARALYEAIRDHPDRGDTDVLLLHSRFLPEDRQRIEPEIVRQFGKEREKEGKWIVVATQVIEVGLDMTCETLHTELAPANAILQRAGRCARYEGEEGNVFVYSKSLDVSSGEAVDLAEHVLPYEGQEQEVRRTLDEIRARRGEILSFGDEEQIVTAAHGAQDRSVVEGLAATREAHRRRMNRVMEGERSGDVGNLVRAVSSRLVVVHDDPLTVLERPFAAEAFSLHPRTVHGMVKQWVRRADEIGLEDYGVRALHDLGDSGESGRSEYGWVPVEEENRKEVAGSVMVLVHPALAGYDPDLGFVPDRGTEYRAKLAQNRVDTPRSAYSYALESYNQHIRLAYQSFQRQAWPEATWAAAKLECDFGWPSGVVERAAHLVVLLHDVGKLNQSWQRWVVRYQRAIGQPVSDGVYAHTDFDPSNPRHADAQKALGSRPSHAVEGATAVAPLLVNAVEECEPVFKAAFTAIARHHGAFTKQGKPYSLVPEASHAVAASLTLAPEHLVVGSAEMMWLSENPSTARIGDFFVNPNNDGEFLAYVVLARALRRADQAGTRKGR